MPVEMLEEWIDESCRAQAPKRLSASVPVRDTGVVVEKGSVKTRGRAVTLDSATERDGEASPLRTAKAPRRQSTVKRGSAAAKKRPAATRASTRGAAKASASNGRATQRGPARAAAETSARATKRTGVSPRAAKKAPKKRARPVA